MYKKKIPAMLLTDFYKVCHREFFHPGTEQLVSYWTPRKSRIPYADHVVCFWLQAFLKDLVELWNETFFSRPWDEVSTEYVDYISNTFSETFAEKEVEAFKKIYDLGYLPIEIKAVPEGSLVPVGCPMIEFRATQNFAFWLAQYLETIASCNLWFSQTAATIAYYNRRILNEWYDKTVDDDIPRASGAGDFSMRGMAGEDAAIMADAGHLLSFSSTATVPTMFALQDYYHSDYTIARGTPSLEHSVMESYGVGQEKEALHHILFEACPEGPLSVISDTWDLWRVLDEYLPEFQDELKRRKGKVVIRPDSGDPVEILCGSDLLYIPLSRDPEKKAAEFRDYFARNFKNNPITLKRLSFQADDEIVEAVISETHELELHCREKTPEEYGVIPKLWKIFGGIVNTKGYRVLPPYIGAIYGDAITHDRAIQIFSRLEKKNFAANNVILGFGSYTYQCVTRDTFGFALKVTHGVVDGVEKPMFKDPVTDRGSHSAGKKSQRGMCIVRKNHRGELMYTDGHTMAEADTPDNLLRPVFLNGKLLVDEGFQTIRKRLYPKF